MDNSSKLSVKTVRAELRRLKAEFNARALPEDRKERAAAILQHLVDMDQFVRHYVVDNSPNFYGKDIDQATHAYKLSDKSPAAGAERAELEKILPVWQRTDDACLRAFKKLLKEFEWFTISAFGEQAEENAWLIAQHADGHPAFQKKALAILEKHLPAGEITPWHYAWLHDRVAVSYYDESKRAPQLYGSQGDDFPIADPKNLNKRRAAFGMKPLKL